MPSVFLSHNSQDKFFVRELAARLRESGARVWLDEAEIKIGESLTDKIGRALDETDFVAVVLSNHSINSEWVQRELQIAVQRELAEREVVVLPILLEAVEIPPFLRDKLYADFSTPESYERDFPRLLVAIGLEVAEPPVEPEEPTEAIATTTPAIERLGPAERKLVSFEDIRMTGLDDQRTYNPDESKALYNVYLTLSRSPPSEWRQIFEAERRFPRHTMWRRAWIEGDAIIVYCVPEELERYHLRDLKQDVENANTKYRQYLTELAGQEQREAEREAQRRNEIRDLKDRLDFD